MTVTSESTSKFVEAAGHKTHYNEAGEGPVLICLHGGGPGASGWSNFKQNLPVFAEHYRTILLDQPGFGETDVPRDGLSGPDHLKAFMDVLGIKSAALIGNSMGGGTAMRFTFTYPEAVDKLVLMGTAGIGPTFLSTGPSVGNNAIRDYYMGQGPTKEKLANLLRLIVYKPDEFLRDDLLEERFQASLRPDVVAWRTALMQRGMPGGAGGINLDTMVECTKIVAPTLLLWGTEDRFNPVEVAYQMVKLIRGARLHVFSECGHWVQVEKAAEFNRLALDFLQN